MSIQRTTTVSGTGLDGPQAYEVVFLRIYYVVAAATKTCYSFFFEAMTASPEKVGGERAQVAGALCHTK